MVHLRVAGRGILAHCKPYQQGPDYVLTTLLYWQPVVSRRNLPMFWFRVGGIALRFESSFSVRPLISHPETCFIELRCRLFFYILILEQPVHKCCQRVHHVFDVFAAPWIISRLVTTRSQGIPVPNVAKAKASDRVRCATTIDVLFRTINK